MQAANALTRLIVEAVASSLSDEFSSDVSTERREPLWRNPLKGKVLSIYANRRFPAPDVPGGHRWTGAREEVAEIEVEYAEPQSSTATQLEHDEEGELAAYDVADLIEAWSMAHQVLAAPAGSALVHRFDWQGSSYQPNERREAYSRYCRVTFWAYLQVDYEG